MSWTVGKIDEETNDSFGYYGDVDVGGEDEIQVAIFEIRTILALQNEEAPEDVSH